MQISPPKNCSWIGGEKFPWVSTGAVWCQPTFFEPERAAPKCGVRAHLLAKKGLYLEVNGKLPPSPSDSVMAWYDTWGCGKHLSTPAESDLWPRKSGKPDLDYSTQSTGGQKLNMKKMQSRNMGRTQPYQIWSSVHWLFRAGIHIFYSVERNLTSAVNPSPSNPQFFQKIFAYQQSKTSTPSTSPEPVI